MVNLQNWEILIVPMFVWSSGVEEALSYTCCMVGADTRGGHLDRAEPPRFSLLWIRNWNWKVLVNLIWRLELRVYKTQELWKNYIQMLPVKPVWRRQKSELDMQSSKDGLWRRRGQERERKSKQTRAGERGAKEAETQRVTSRFLLDLAKYDLHGHLCG